MVIGFASGCNGNQNEFIQGNSTFGISQVHTSKPIDQSVANHAKEKIIEGRYYRRKSCEY